jgi:hypothetical protein
MDASRWGLPIGIALVVSGCGVGQGGGTAAEPPITRAELAVMVVPLEEIGAPAVGMHVDDDSGPSGNKEGAEDTIDPKDTADSLARAGRLHGYDLTYSTPRQMAIWRKGGGYTDVTTSVELFETESAASAYLDDQIADFERYRGRGIGNGVRLTRSEVFEVALVGDEGWGVRAKLRFGDLRVNGTIVAFRRGSVVGAASIGRGDSLDIAAQVRTVARVLDRRIQAVLAGELRSDPVPLPGKRIAVGAKRLAAMTLSLKDLPARVSVTGEHRRKTTSNRVVYFRSFDVAKVKIGRSHFLTLRAETQLFEHNSDARDLVQLLQSPRGHRLVAREFAKGFARDAGIPAGRLTVRRVPGLPSETVGIVISVRTPRGPFKALLITVRVRNAVQTLSAFGPADSGDPRDLQQVAEKARARLEANLPRA